MQTLLDLSADFLIAAKRQTDMQGVFQQMHGLSLSDFLEKLEDDSPKKVFWINVYNGLVLFHKKKWMDNQSTTKLPKSFFTEQIFFFEGKKYSMSLDDIEHGILRQQIYRFSNPFFQPLATAKVDERIHFALNCGAKSCPPIRFYQLISLDSDLDRATFSYLEQETLWDSDANRLVVSELLKWYIDDFGGEKGLVTFLEKYEVLPPFRQPKLRFKPYDWALI